MHDGDEDYFFRIQAVQDAVWKSSQEAAPDAGSNRPARLGVFTHTSDAVLHFGEKIQSKPDMPLFVEPGRFDHFFLRRLEKDSGLQASFFLASSIASRAGRALILPSR